MRLFASVAIAAALLAGPALAADPMASAYGNTVVIVYGDGTTVNLYVNEDGTYTGSSPAGESAGTWAISGGQTCFTQSSPEPTPPSCSKTVNKNVGDSWQGEGQGGAPVTISIQAGR
ncbi:MAG TPA: hypothetical protein PLF78_12560 [Caulobacter sp.]|nr:hypothetical protein [Caulobacter sp.]